jgi:hypothetical protein
MRGREAAVGVAHEAQALHRPVAVLERQRQVVGAAQSGHLVQDLMVALWIQIEQAAPEAAPGPDDGPDGLP